MRPMAAHPKPDPSLGVFETTLVVHSAPVALEAHLARLETSLQALYGMGLPARARQLATERAEGLELGRLRLTVAPDDGELAYEVEASELDRSLHFPRHPVALHPHTVGGGLGCHKWVDRAAIPAKGSDEVPLLVDGEEALEAAWANVFAVRKGALFTPPLDGRILPGVTRSTVIELAKAQGVEVVEAHLTVAELQEAGEIFLTNSIRGLVAVGSVDGTPLESKRPCTRSFGSALRASWGLAPIPAS